MPVLSVDQSTVQCYLCPRTYDVGTRQGVSRYASHVGAHAADPSAYYHPSRPAASISQAFRGGVRRSEGHPAVDILYKRGVVSHKNFKHMPSAEAKGWTLFAKFMDDVIDTTDLRAEKFPDVSWDDHMSAVFCLTVKASKTALASYNKKGRFTVAKYKAAILASYPNEKFSKEQVRQALDVMVNATKECIRREKAKETSASMQGQGQRTSHQMAIASAIRPRTSTTSSYGVHSIPWLRRMPGSQDAPLDLAMPRPQSGMTAGLGMPAPSILARPRPTQDNQDASSRITGDLFQPFKRLRN